MKTFNVLKLQEINKQLLSINEDLRGIAKNDDSTYTVMNASLACQSTIKEVSLALSSSAVRMTIRKDYGAQQDLLLAKETETMLNLKR